MHTATGVGHFPTGHLLPGTIHFNTLMLHQESNTLLSAEDTLAANEETKATDEH